MAFLEVSNVGKLRLTRELQRRAAVGKMTHGGKRAQQVSLFKATEMTLRGRGAGQTLVAAGWRAGSRKEPYACRTEAPCFQHQWKSAM